MAPPPTKQPAARKRTRKRKRRAASSSSESSSTDDSSSDSETPRQAVVRVPVKHANNLQPQAGPSEESSSTSSSSESDTDKESDVEPTREHSSNKAATQKAPRRTPSPTPPPSTVPPFLLSKDAAEEEKVLKERFRKFWMASVADAFKDDLEELRKEPHMTTSRLAMLIDSLAAGGEVLAASRVGPDTSMTEMEIVLEHNT